MVTVIIGAVAAIFSLGKPSMAAAFLAFFCIFLTWFNLGLHLPLSAAVSDFCYDVFDYGIEQRLTDLDVTKGTNYGGLDDILKCPRWDLCNITFEYARELRQQQQEGQNMSTTTQQSAQYQANIDILDNLLVEVLYLKQCRWLINVFEPLKSRGFCEIKFGGVVAIWASSFVISLLMIPFAIASIMGFKRFPRAEDDGFF